ncbi:mannitol dehydrogenase family protein [Microbacterium sp. ET2]|uniref:mannitol dehydrogenase family protein n=1 Tax=Microbacterium albipurpureum TaxID=3050384 RepID=UPI00259CA097|nr:mannitol dehydrogenase family protein [Microbacterium sp. ET2 (Ac-2212)]WJL96852.1 mannitol dehydrogenase family protein [Microbacterium sp. ET2 (Ac-2212)]
MTPPPPPRLTRDALVEAGRARRPAPIRIVHIGIGAFHRTHQAWYTSRAGDAENWGIAGFTGRSPGVADQLAAQGGVYTLVERGRDGDRFHIVDSISEARASVDLDRFVALVSAPATSVVSMTITEAGYYLAADGRLDTDHPDVVADLTALRDGRPGVLHTPAARLTLALRDRAAKGAGPIAVVPCDNLPDNGRAIERSVTDVAVALGWDPTAWQVSFVSTSIDRITPHTTPNDLRAVEDATGFRDEAAVVAEPFSDWVLAGDFPAGRPRWEDTGARFVGDIAPFERRKLLMLNGGHLALAFRGLLRGCTTVAEAMGDPACRVALDRFWDEAERAVGAGAETAGYRRQLVERFENDRIGHRLDQIAVDTATKVRLRVLPVLSAEREVGGLADGALGVIRDWSVGARRGAFPAGITRLDDLTSGATSVDRELISAAIVAS